MRQYNQTLQNVVAALAHMVIFSFVAVGVVYGEEPYYSAAPPVTQSDGYGVVPYAPHTPTMVTRPASWPQNSLQTPSGLANPQVQQNAMTSGGYNAGGYPLTSGYNTMPNYNVTSGRNAVPNYNAASGYGVASNYDANPPCDYNVTSQGYNAGASSAVNYDAGLTANHSNPVRRTDIPFTEKIEIKPVYDARLLARVGSEVVLASDVMALVVNRTLGEAKEPIPEEYREKIIENFIAGAIETKLIYAEVVRSLPEEGLAGFRSQIKKNFIEDKDEGIPALQKKAGVKTREELEEKLRMLGSSLEAQERFYVEQIIARYWLMQEVNVSEPVTHDQMLAYYHEHGADFDNKARARWEQLTVRFSRHPDKQEAFQLIAQAGNQVMQGVPFAEVAKRFSEGSTSGQGGQRDWTHQESLASENLNIALFALPLGQLSRIIEDETGYHIIRVTQREEAYRTPFLKAQASIKKKLTDERFKERVKEYLAKIRKETMVWTVYDDKKERHQNVANTPGSNARR